MQINSLHDFRRAMRNGKYAWPGGYPCYFVTSDGAALSFDAVKENRKVIAASIARQLCDGWNVVALEINWEDADLICEHTGERIESAYAEA